tara:strand:+ start:516 stop:935 length:420 start_codon:yes stop_codon:yes gene_type:complete
MYIINFTPIPAFLGGSLIGLAVAFFFVFNGRLIGVSGIASNFLTSKDNRFDNFLFLVGLIIGPIVYKIFSQQEINISISNSFYLLAVAGLLVGVGTRIGGGCTSGHGISGIGRFSLSSIVATATFMIVAISTFYLERLL